MELKNCIVNQNMMTHLIFFLISLNIEHKRNLHALLNERHKCEPAVIFLSLISISKNNSEHHCSHTIYRTFSDIQHIFNSHIPVLIIYNAKKIARNRYFVTYLING